MHNTISITVIFDASFMQDFWNGMCLSLMALVNSNITPMFIVAYAYFSCLFIMPDMSKDLDY